MRRWLRTFDQQLPRSVQTLQAGGLVSAFGNGLLIPYLFIYLHNVRDIGLGTAGLIVAANAVVSIAAGPIFGSLVDRVGGRTMLAIALVVLAVGYGSFALVVEPWQGFLASVVTGIGNGGFWPAQSTMLAALSPPHRRHATFAMQRVTMNLGIGLGALVGGLIADAARPNTFVALFLLDALTFVVYLGVLLAAVPEVAHGGGSSRSGSYATVFRHRAFVGVVGLNTLFIFAGMSGFELLPVFAKNEIGVSESAIGVIFFVNTVVIVVAQLPIAKLSEGHRRMRMLALLGVLWAACWVGVSVVGWRLRRRPRRPPPDRRDGGIRDRRVHPRRGAGAARQRSRRSPAARPLHGALRLVVAGRVRARTRRGRLLAPGQPARHLARVRRSCARSAPRSRSCSNAPSRPRSGGRRSSSLR